jgi:AraC-like DNA-binding protein
MKNKVIQRPITGVLPLLRFAMNRGVKKKSILEHTNLTEINFLDPKNEISLRQEMQMVRNLIAQFPEPETSWNLGQYYYARTHDILGNMMECAPTIGDIVSGWCDYCFLMHTYCRVVPEAVGKRFRLNILNKYSLPPELDTFLLERDVVVGISVWEERLTGVTQQLNLSLSFVHAPRTEIEKYNQFFPFPVSFNQSINFAEFDKSALSIPLPGSDPYRFELFRQQCQVEFSLRNEARFFLSDRVRLCLQVAKGQTSLSDIAKKLNMDERSMRYQLAKEGTQFRKIKKQFVFQQSLIFLRDPKLNIDEISHALGYSETAAFSRAFDRWMGISPSEYRNGITAAS